MVCWIAVGNGLKQEKRQEVPTKVKVTCPHSIRGHVYQTMTKRLREALAGHIREKYGVELAIVLERPPKIEMGEAASPVCFELAKRLKKAPRMIAQEIANGLGKVEGIAKVEVAGGGDLDADFERAVFWGGVIEGNSWERGKRAERRDADGRGKNRKIIVEPTRINQN